MEKTAKKVLTIIIGILLIFLAVVLIQNMENNTLATILLLVGIGITLSGITMKTKYHAKKQSPLSSAFKKEPAKEPLNADNDDD